MISRSEIQRDRLHHKQLPACSVFLAAEDDEESGTKCVSLRASIRFAFVVPSVILRELSRSGEWRCCVYCTGTSVASQCCKIHSLQHWSPHHAHMFSFEVKWNWDYYGEYRFWQQPVVHFLSCADMWLWQTSAPWGWSFMFWLMIQAVILLNPLVYALKCPSKTNRLPRPCLSRPVVWEENEEEEELGSLGSASERFCDVSMRALEEPV